MKKSFVIVCALVTLAGANSWAQTNAFPVKLNALVAYPQSATAVSRLGVTEASLVAAGHSLVLVVDQSNHEMRLDEVDSNKALVATLMTSRRLALLPDSSFSAGMTFNFVLPPQSNSTPANGDLNVTGKISFKGTAPKNIKGAVIGVLNDGTHGGLDVTLKGKFSSGGAPFDGGPGGL
jgi:hypothetical protein